MFPRSKRSLPDLADPRNIVIYQRPSSAWSLFVNVISIERSFTVISSGRSFIVISSERSESRDLYNQYVNKNHYQVNSLVTIAHILRQGEFCAAVPGSVAGS